ncbi:MAG: hypothetical protein ACKO6J_00565, partial [Crocinitomicaceae bacterium]
MGNFALLLKRYSVPTIFLVVGIAVLYVAFSGNQAIQFKISGVLMLLGSLFSFLNTSDRSNVVTNWAIGGVSLALAAYATIASYNSVETTRTHQEDYKKTKLTAERNLQDLRTIQSAFLKRYGKYAATWEELLGFAENDYVWEDDDAGSVPARRITPEELKYLVSIGFKTSKDGVVTVYKVNQAIDNKMTEEEAVALSKMKTIPEDLVGFKRDSVKVQFIETTFIRNQSYMKERLDLGLGDFNTKALRYIPGKENQEWKLKSKILKGQDGTITHATRISGTIPFSKYENGEPEEMFFGNLQTGDLKGSWED